MAGVNEKRLRTTAKRKFTRCHNRLNDDILNNEAEDIIVSKFKDLKLLWDNAQSAHDTYIFAAHPEADAEEALEEEEGWLDELGEKFEMMEKLKCKYLHSLQIARKEATELKVEQSLMDQTNEKVQAAEKRQNSLKALLLQEIKGIEDLIKMDKNGLLKPQVVAGVKDAKMYLEKCKEAHLAYESSISVERIEIEQDEWIKGTFSIYEHLNQAVYKYLENISENEAKEKKSLGMRMERLKMPSFNGNIRSYAKFKVDFQKQVEIQVGSEDTLAYILKSCLSEEASFIVENIDDVKEMWKRLDKRFGQPSLLIDVVMNEVRGISCIHEEDHNGFLQLANIIEKGHADLSRLKLEKEISNSITVSMIEKKLPPSIRREWSKEVNKDGSEVDPYDKFPRFLKFLLEQRSILEYEIANLRIRDCGEATVYGMYESSTKVYKTNRCILHNTNNHNTEECSTYLSKTPQEKVALLKRERACWSCLRIGHRAVECRFKKPCGINNCNRFHHNSIHEAQATGFGLHAVESKPDEGYGEVSTKCFLQLMKLEVWGKNLSILWDSGASISLITFKKARELNLKGKSVHLSVIKVGGQVERVSSYIYVLPLIDKMKKVVNIKVYGIEKISEGFHCEDVSSLIHAFKEVNLNEIERPRGEIDVLVGFNYASLHPTKLQSFGNLMLMGNRFGKCLAGSHPTLSGKHQLVIGNVEVYHAVANEESFLKLEEVGVQSWPLCGNCRCGKCALGAKGLSLNEEREQNLITKGLSYLKDEGCWLASYPWKKNPADLPDNFNVALRMLENTERRLLKNHSHAQLYDTQIKDMLNRKVARILTEEEIKEYNGPYYYLSHHEVLREENVSTPCRIVFNSSAKFLNQTLNDYWAKGANLVNNLIGVIIRFRENKIAVTGDIEKMYHAVKIGMVDQHTHRFLWRNLEVNQPPQTYVMTSVSFGDKPAGNIAMAALHKTAERGREISPRAADTVIRNTYVDDIIDSVDSEVSAKEMTKEIDELIQQGGFKVKKWVISSNDHTVFGNEELKIKGFSENHHNVLGMIWDQSLDLIQYKIKLNFSRKRRGVRDEPNLKVEDVPEKLPSKLTKRLILSQINSIFDPMGLIAPFTVKAKIMLKTLWQQKLDWDEEVAYLDRERVVSFFSQMFDVEKLSFRRCMKPDEYVGDPILVTFSDASNDAFGSCSYLRWEIKDGTYKSMLVASKNRVAPLKVLSIVRLELCAAVLAKRLSQFIEQETRFRIERKYFLVDSQVVRSMIAKESYAFNTFVAVRLGEIQETTNVEDWYWIEGSHNIADWVTRGKMPLELDLHSVWQNGPEFLEKPETEWPIKGSVITNDLPEESKLAVVSCTTEDNSVENLIDINRHSKYVKLIDVTGRMISVFRGKPSLKNIFQFPSRFISEAEVLWILEAQKLMAEGIERGYYKRLCPRKRDDDVIIVGGRVEPWFSDTYNLSGLILLPYNHRISRLYAEFIHGLSHLGTAATMCKIRDRFWITRLSTMVNSIRNKCVSCKKLNLQLQQQVMSKIPIHRLKPCPAFYNTYLDYFGPFTTKGVINKRSRGKVFGILFTCGNSRAVYCDLSQDYSMDGFLQTLRRFTSVRGYPANIWSDCGTQLVAASKELRNMIKGFDKEKLIEFGAHKGLQWHFGPPDAPWRNGCAESLIKSVKKAIKVAIGEQILSFPELQTIFFEVSNIVNERPIGILNKQIEDYKYLCPNDLLLGRASNRVPSGPFTEDFNAKRRFLFIQSLIGAFWKVWIRDYFPSLLIRQKWHTQKRNVRIGDIVLIRDLNVVRGEWRLGQVEKVYPSENDDIVRSVDVRYKNVTNKRCTVVKRAIQSLVVLLPTEENVDE